MEAYHVGFLPSFLATLSFMVPTFYLYASGYYMAMLAYNFVMLYLIINGFSNKRWASELDERAWFHIWKKDFAKIFILKRQIRKHEA